jgi:hypothetical protein
MDVQIELDFLNTHLSSRFHDLLRQLLCPCIQLLSRLLSRRLQLLSGQALRCRNRLRLDLVCQRLDDLIIHLIRSRLGLHTKQDPMLVYLRIVDQTSPEGTGAKSRKVREVCHGCKGR